MTDEVEEVVVEGPMVVPDTHNPEEFMNDEALAKWHAQKHAALQEDDPEKAAAAQAVRRAKVAAAITAAAGDSGVEESVVEEE